MLFHEVLLYKMCENDVLLRLISVSPAAPSDPNTVSAETILFRLHL
jgi:hypothetical protein